MQVGFYHPNMMENNAPYILISETFREYATYNYTYNSVIKFWEIT